MHENMKNAYYNTLVWKPEGNRVHGDLGVH
jgi:hypothetical protein